MRLLARCHYWQVPVGVYCCRSSISLVSLENRRRVSLIVNFRELEWDKLNGLINELTSMFRRHSFSLILRPEPSDMYFWKKRSLSRCKMCRVTCWPEIVVEREIAVSCQSGVERLSCNLDLEQWSTKHSPAPTSAYYVPLQCNHCYWCRFCCRMTVWVQEAEILEEEHRCNSKCEIYRVKLCRKTLRWLRTFRIKHDQHLISLWLYRRCKSKCFCFFLTANIQE